MRASAAAVVGVLVVALGASGGSALAGGVAFVDWERNTYGWGEVARGHTRDVYFRTAPGARRAIAAGDFVVYLDPDYRPAEYWKGTRWPRPHGVSRDWILAGRVTLSSSWAPNLVRADAELAVPEVAPGKYTAILCDRGCTTPLGDVSPSDVRVVRSATVAHVRPALVRLRSELRSEVEALEGNVSHTRSEQAAESYAVETELQELRTDVRRMAAELIAQRERRDLWSYAAWFAAGAAAVFAVALVSSRRRWRVADHAPRASWSA
jgi:hypothetical protein